MKRVQPGDTVTVQIPYAEVCMHLRIAGQVRKVEVRTHVAQILNDDGTPFSFPITHGEAGIYTDAHGLYIQEEMP